MRYILFCILLLGGFSSSGQEAGYRNIVLIDSGRRYKPNAHLGDHLYYRPIEIDCWYPATPGATPIHYGEFLQLFQQRANRFQQDTVYSSLAGEMAQYLCAGLSIADTASLTGLFTQSYWNADPIRRRFPFIVYMCSYNGMCYENIRLFEALAHRGYIIASITSVGRYPGNMTMSPEDLKEQVADGLVAINFLRKSGSIDTTKIGLIGYSWGGPAALLITGSVNVAAVLSLDGSELHYYGQSPEEDNLFNQLRPSLLQMVKSRFAYAYLESGGKQDEGSADSLFTILPALQGPKKYIRFPAATHEDFSCLPYLAARIRKTDSSALPGYPTFAVKWFDNYLKGGENRLPADSSYPVVSSMSGKRTAIAARVLDAEDKTPLAYVNVGIPGENTGTVTNDDGSFKLHIDSHLSNDSLAVSMAGYVRRLIPLKKVPGIILLDRKSGALNEAVVTQIVRPTKIIGNTTASKLLSVGFPMRFLGAEIGVKMALGKHPRRLEKFHCHVSDTRIDSAIFRLNIYRMVNGNTDNVLKRNVLLSIGKIPADYTVDLSSLNLILSGDVLVSLELLRSYPSLANPGAVFFSAAFFNSGTWRRQTSQAQWKKAHGIGVGFNLEVR